MPWRGQESHSEGHTATSIKIRLQRSSPKAQQDFAVLERVESEGGCPRHFREPRATLRKTRLESRGEP